MANRAAPKGYKLVKKYVGSGGLFHTCSISGMTQIFEEAAEGLIDPRIEVDSYMDGDSDFYIIGFRQMTESEKATVAQRAERSKESKTRAAAKAETKEKNELLKLAKKYPSVVKVLEQ